jgi:hypothetical protein
MPTSCTQGSGVAILSPDTLMESHRIPRKVNMNKRMTALLQVELKCHVPATCAEQRLRGASGGHQVLGIVRDYFGTVCQGKNALAEFL